MLLQPEKHIYQALIANVHVARRIGFRAYAIAVPNTAVMPFLVYKRSNILREPVITGHPLYMPMLSIQVSSWAMTHDEARELADDVRLALDYRQATLAGVTIEDMRLVSETDDFLDPTTVGAQLPPAYEVRQLWQCRWQESPN